MKYKCSQCSKIFFDNKSKNRKFCSQKCKIKNQNGGKILRKAGLRLFKRKCVICGKIYFSYNGNNVKFCNIKCYGKSKRKRLDIDCKFCGKHINIVLSKNEYYKNHFCSVGCRDKYKKSKRIIKICLRCKKDFETLPKRKARFCSHFCSSQYKVDQRVVVNCSYCNKKLFRSNCDIYSNNYCNRKCRNKYDSTLTKEKSYMWQGGKSFEPYGLEFDKKLKEQIRKRDNYICRDCGSVDNRSLSTHHVDYNKRNNVSTNLISLCHSCHSKTNFNRLNWIEHYKQKLNG